MSSFTVCIRVVSSAYLRLLIVSLANLITVCKSSSPSFHMMHSVCKLNTALTYFYSNFKPVCCSMFSSTSCSFSCIQEKETDNVVWHSHLFKNISKHVLLFSVVNEAEDFQKKKFTCHFYDPVYIGSQIPGSSAFSKSSFQIRRSQFMCC